MVKYRHACLMRLFVFNDTIKAIKLLFIERDTDAPPPSYRPGPARYQHGQVCIIIPRILTQRRQSGNLHRGLTPIW